MCQNKIETVADVQDFIEFLIDTELLNFHPDTAFSDYVNYESGESTFTAEKAAYYQDLLDKAFDVCEKAGGSIYEVGLEHLKSRLVG